MAFKIRVFKVECSLWTTWAIIWTPIDNSDTSFLSYRHFKGIAVPDESSASKFLGKKYLPAMCKNQL